MCFFDSLRGHRPLLAANPCRLKLFSLEYIYVLPFFFSSSFSPRFSPLSLPLPPFHLSQLYVHFALKREIKSFPVPSAIAALARENMESITYLKKIMVPLQKKKILQFSRERDSTIRYLLPYKKKNFPQGAPRIFPPQSQIQRNLKQNCPGANTLTFGPDCV